MPKRIIKSNAHEAHHENDKTHSWYWSVLVKNLGNWVEAEKAIRQSRFMCDPRYMRDVRLKHIKI